MKATLTTLLAALLAAAALATSASAGDGYVPFVTDFPRSQQTERYVPFVSDFPSSPAQAPSASVAARVTDGFDWLDAAFGAAVGAALGVLGAASLPALRRRTDVSPA